LNINGNIKQKKNHRVFLFDEHSFNIDDLLSTTSVINTKSLTCYFRQLATH